MNKNSLRRRQLLWYGGLGIAGAGAAIVLGKLDPKIASTPREMISISDQSDLLSPVAQAASRPQLPEFQGISQWLNSQPLSIASLKGKVVLVQFWTFSCINCQRTLPYIVKWHQRYATQGLQVIGVHTPEFAFERDPNNVRKALQRYQIAYPVPMDNEFKTWNAYRNRYWPNLYLADRQGFLRYSHAGEGAYDVTEQRIQQLLG
jgi:thiol-disulfide isomerase/thioredoxin